MSATASDCAWGAVWRVSDDMSVTWRAYNRTPAGEPAASSPPSPPASPTAPIAAALATYAAAAVGVRALLAAAAAAADEEEEEEAAAAAGAAVTSAEAARVKQHHPYFASSAAAAGASTTAASGAPALAPGLRVGGAPSLIAAGEAPSPALHPFMLRSLPTPVDTHTPRGASALARLRERGALQVEWRWGSAAEGRAWREVVSERLPGASHLATALPSADARLHSCGMRLTVSKPNQLVHWESPLVAAQRAEGFVSFYSVPSTGACCVGSNEDEDEDEDEDAATTTATAARAQGTESVYRMSPVDVQRLMCYILQAAMEQHADMVAVHSASAAATGAEEGHRAKLLATRTLITLRNAALSLYDMRERVLSGGEAWTRFEMFQKYAKLKGMAAEVQKKLNAEQEVTEQERSIINAFEAGLEYFEEDASDLREVEDEDEEAEPRGAAGSVDELDASLTPRTAFAAHASGISADAAVALMARRLGAMAPPSAESASAGAAAASASRAHSCCGHGPSAASAPPGGE